MAFFRVKVGEKTYELDRLTLGEARTLKKEFGLKNLAMFDGTDPDQLVGLLYLALLREQPGLGHEAALAEIENLDIEGFAPAVDDEEGDEVNPSVAPAVETAPSSSEAGGSETTLDDVGAPSSLSVVQA